MTGEQVQTNTAQRETVYVNPEGVYRCTFGNPDLHEWIVAEANRLGCTSIPEYVRRTMQDLFAASKKPARAIAA